MLCTRLLSSFCQFLLCSQRLDQECHPLSKDIRIAIRQRNQKVCDLLQHCLRSSLCGLFFRLLRVLVGCLFLVGLSFSSTLQGFRALQRCSLHLYPFPLLLKIQLDLKRLTQRLLLPLMFSRFSQKHFLQSK